MLRADPPCLELVGYLEWWDHTCDPRKRNSKKSSTTAVVQTQAEGDVAWKASTLAVAADDGGEYQVEVQTLDYDVRKSTEVPPNNQDVSTVDTNDMPNASGDDDQQALPIYQEETESDIPNASSDDDPQTRSIYQKESERLIPNQSLAEDALVIEHVRTLS
ncbi:hypothetical protein U1Q18_037970 [Sarracenia purpurea var. burkii]